jgi:DNA/RNA-binding domain of Phe-tRNA-synthetase-like protein
MRDAKNALVGGQADEGKTGEELAREQEEEDRERQAFIDAWKAMYRRKGIDPDTYRIDWDAVFEGERGE